ncbi:MAG: polysaccharide pyruvyl transferase family protein [Myxococcota bacterium]|jgi:polysaccharide pyruvyl transferase WcaK-like protein
MLKDYLNMDVAMESTMAGIIELSRYIPFEKWEKGKKLKVLLVGYNGARNTGADVRVEAMVKQLYHVFGEENIHIGVMTLDAAHSANYYKPPSELIQFSSVFFRDLLKAASGYHTAILCEGSCFKSKFANALTTFFFGAAGIMKAQGKTCVAYGSEAGKMDEVIKGFVKHYCDETFIISRTEPSAKVVEELGFKGLIGTDTAWTFEPGPKERAVELLKNAGWDGKKPVVGVAVINPFYWPIKPDFKKFVSMKMKGQKLPDNYDKWYFFSTSQERTDLQNRYLDAVAAATDAFVEKHNAFPIIIGMERLDMRPNTELNKRLKNKAPIFCSEDYNGYEMTSILWQLSMLVTSRYHARVLAMGAGVPAIAISMDERLENLFGETGHLKDYYLRVDDAELGGKLLPMMEKLWKNRVAVREQVLKTIPGYLRKMAAMGRDYKDYIRGHYPELPMKPDSADIMDYLPPLFPELKAIVSKFA